MKTRHWRYHCHILVGLAALLALSACASTQETTQAAPEPQPAPQAAPQPAAPPPAEPQPEPPPAVQEPAPPAAEPPAPEKPAGGIILTGARTHRVVWRDTLSKIAMRYYGRGNGYYYPLIILGNPELKRNPDHIVGGMRLVIPDLSRNLNNQAARAELKACMTELAEYYAQRRNRVMSANLRSLAQTL